jgi:hypothetical protein
MNPLSEVVLSQMMSKVSDVEMEVPTAHVGGSGQTPSLGNKDS